MQKRVTNTLISFQATYDLCCLLLLLFSSIIFANKLLKLSTILFSWACLDSQGNALQGLEYRDLQLSLEVKKRQNPTGWEEGRDLGKLE